MLNADGVEDESVGQQYLETHNNWPAQMWIQTSYNTYNNTHKSGDDSKAFRGNYAGIGSILGTKIIISFGLKNLMHLG